VTLEMVRVGMMVVSAGTRGERADAVTVGLFRRLCHVFLLPAVAAVCLVLHSGPRLARKAFGARLLVGFAFLSRDNAKNSVGGQRGADGVSIIKLRQQKSATEAFPRQTTAFLLLCLAFDHKLTPSDQ